MSIEIPKPAAKVAISEPLRALRHRGLLVTGLVALFYNFGFFTLLAYTPFFVGAAAVVVALGVLVAGRRSFAEQPEAEPEQRVPVAVPVVVPA
jgi:hypothetical protein